MTIDEILAEPKHIVRQRRFTLTQDQAHWRANVPLVCDNLSISMSIFIRKLIAREEDFSIGLRLNQAFDPFQFPVVLVRFQGPHGGQSALRSGKDMHNSYHIHCFSEEDLQRHRKYASYRDASDFDSFDQAVINFLDYCNIKDPYAIFGEERQRCNQLRMQLEVLPSWEE